MQGDRKVIDYLNNGLRHELTAINQYCEKHQPDIAQWLGDPSEGETRAHCQYAENDKNQHGNRRSLAQQVHQHCCPRYTGLIGLTKGARSGLKREARFRFTQSDQWSVQYASRCRHAVPA